MGSGESDRFRQELLVETLAKKAGISRLNDALPGPRIYGPYLFYGLLLVGHYGILGAYMVLQGRTHQLLENPTRAAVPIGILLAVFGVRYMADTYARAVADLRINERADRSQLAAFERILPRRITVAVWIVALLAMGWNLVYNFGLDAMIADLGLGPGIVTFGLIYPIGYLPLGVEFALLFFSIHFALPRRIARSDIGMFFYDPRNLGGFGSIGQLLKGSYYLFTAGLLLYFLFIYGPAVASLVVDTLFQEPGLPEAIFFSSAWFVGLLSVGFSMWTIHNLMATEKRQRIRELESELTKTMENPYDIHEATITDEEKLAEVQRRLQRVREAGTYPTTFALWSQILASVILPQTLQMAVQLS